MPPGCEPAAVAIEERGGVHWTAARWTPEELERLAARLVEGRAALRQLPDDRLLAAWSSAVETFLDPRSPPRTALELVLHRLCGLSPQGLEAGLETVLRGVTGEPALRLLADAQPAPDDRPVVVLLASSLPGLAVQLLLPVLALRRPVVLKSPSAEPLFAPAFVRELVRREPALRSAVAALTWRGGDRTLEEPLFAAAGKIVAYGGRRTLEDVERRAPGRLVAFGPRTSLAVIGPQVTPDQVADGLARDVALFDQRAVLSVCAVYTAGDPGALASRLARALATAAERWPPGALDAAAAAEVQQLRSEAELRGLAQPELPLAAGTVIVEPMPEPAPAPGLRTVRVHPLADLTRLPELLAPWSGRLQGAALAGPEAWALEESLAALGLCRFAAPGELHSRGALWLGGGEHPLAVLAS